MVAMFRTLARLPVVEGSCLEAALAVGQLAVAELKPDLELTGGRVAAPGQVRGEGPVPAEGQTPVRDRVWASGQGLRASGQGLVEQGSNLPDHRWGEWLSVRVAVEVSLLAVLSPPGEELAPGLEESVETRWLRERPRLRQPPLPPRHSVQVGCRWPGQLLARPSVVVARPPNLVRPLRQQRPRLALGRASP